MQTFASTTGCVASIGVVLLLFLFLGTQVSQLTTVKGLNNYQDGFDTFSDKYGPQITNFKTNNTVSTDRTYLGFNDGVFPLFLWARGVLCDELNIKYAFRDVNSGTTSSKNPEIKKTGLLTCYPNTFWGASVYSLPFDV
jgi:hypothetical protein